MQTVLPALATLRRQTGLPHRIVVDEAHYFLDDPHVPNVLDVAAGGSTLVTYRASKLRSDLLARCEAIIVTRESDPQEVRALHALCHSCAGPKSESEWALLFESIVMGEAVALPVTEEAAGDVRRIRLSPRLTPHVRHLAKYVDLPVSEGHAFVFWRDGSCGRRARTLREFVSIVEQSPVTELDGHFQRHDFSNWIMGVFGDYPLAKTLREIEDDYLAGVRLDVTSSLARAVRARYELIDPGPELNA
jgi:hypothetical protein